MPTIRNLFIYSWFTEKRIPERLLQFGGLRFSSSKLASFRRQPRCVSGADRINAIWNLHLRVTACWVRQKKEREQKEASVLTPDKLLINSRGRTSAVSFSASRLQNEFIRAGVDEYFWERERERKKQRGGREKEKKIERQLIEIFRRIF